jgi:RimJ/RimL family protein N-acetyltransferase
MSDDLSLVATDTDLDSEGSPAATEELLPLRDGRYILLRQARPDDAHVLLTALNEVANEGRFLLRRAWEITPDLEARWIRVALAESDLVLVGLLLDNIHNRTEIEVAGSLSLVRGRPEFVRHTAELGMWLRASYRELGLGSAMLEYALRWAQAHHDLEKITLSARSSNRRALNLYRKYGFIEEGRRHGNIKTTQGYESEVLLGRFVAGPMRPGLADPPRDSYESRGLPADEPADGDTVGDTGG